MDRNVYMLDNIVFSNAVTIWRSVEMDGRYTVITDTTHGFP